MLKRALKRLPTPLQQRLRHFGRLRWLEKARLLRMYEVRPGDQPLTWGRYVLLDPEVGDFTYRLANEEEFVRGMAEATGRAPEELTGYRDELASDAELTTELRRRLRWRLDTKRRVDLGPRVAWYAAVRALKPALVVEAGIKHGYGSLVLLRALERNAHEGHPGHLISFDPDVGSGWVVPPRLTAGWQNVVATTDQALESTLEGLAVDLFICDTPPGYELERREFECALRHSAGVLVAIASNGKDTTALPELADAHGAPYRYLPERPANHWFRGAGLGVAVFD